MAANNIAIFDADFNVVVELNDTPLYYTSIFKWFSFGKNAPETITLGLTVTLSRRVRLMTVNTVQVGTHGTWYPILYVQSLSVKILLPSAEKKIAK